MLKTPKKGVSGIEILKYMSISYIVLFLFFLIVHAFYPCKIGRGWYVAGALAIVSIAFCGFHFTPSKRLDVYRLSQVVNTMRAESQTITEALFTAEDQYGGLYFFRLICYFVAQTDSNHWLTVISIVLTIGPLYVVLLDYLRNEGYTSSAILPSLMLLFMGMQMPYIFSGVRNTIAVSSAVSALYLMFYKRKHYILSTVLCIVALSTHQMILVLVPTILVGYTKKHQWGFRIAALCSMPVIFIVAELLLKVPSNWTQQLATRITHYSDRAYGSDRPEMIANILVFLAVSLSHWILGLEHAYDSDDRLEKSYWNAYCFLGCMMIGCALRRDFTLRIGYIMGIASIPIVCRILFKLRHMRWKKSNYRVLAAVLVFGILICCGKVYYDCWFSMSQWNFSIVR